MVPVAEGVNVTEHVPATRAQLAALNEPAAPVLVNDTLPVGVDVVPAAVSVTVAVHVEAWFTKTGEVQETAVLVVRRLTTTELVPLLVACVVSPPYVPVMLAVPAAVAVNVTEHVPSARVQLAAGVKLPAGPVSVKLTDPVGVEVVPGEVSATVAEQVEPWLMKTGLVHDTVVEVARGLTVIEPVPLLPA